MPSSKFHCHSLLTSAYSAIMMTHSVFFWLKHGLSDQDLQKFENGLRGLFSIDQIAQGSIGSPAATPERPVTDKSFSYSLILKFKSVEDHDVYQDHADHHHFVDNCKHLWDRVVVYDSQEI